MKIVIILLFDLRFMYIHVAPSVFHSLQIINMPFIESDSKEIWGCLLMSGVKMQHFSKDWWKFIQIHQYYTLALTWRCDSFIMWYSNCSFPFFFSLQFLCRRCTRTPWSWGWRFVSRWQTMYNNASRLWDKTTPTHTTTSPVYAATLWNTCLTSLRKAR